MIDLPIATALPEIAARLEAGRALVLLAPPGAGKTTGVPPALLDAPWLAGQRIVMLEPRRLAARAACTRIAAQLGEAPGQTAGWRIRLDTRIGPATRIEVVTEGILARMIQDDPALDGIGLVIFDEFHERSLHADLGLALAIEVQQGLRDDLRLMVMSATLDGAPVARLLGDAPVVECPGRAFPVETRHLNRPPPGRLAEAMAQALPGILAETEGDVLAFLPGAGEIRRVAGLIESHPALAGVRITPLFGDLTAEEQDRAIRPRPDGGRKLVLATAIAQTSLTIEGVRVVVDGGLSRTARFDPGSGMTRLVTGPVSRATADQRRGRAGRLGPGLCYRLWSAADERALAPHDPPEILGADLAPLALDLARWGEADATRLAWLDPPPDAHLSQARALLHQLGALDAQGRITAHGRAMARLPAHPRLAHMMLRGQALGLGGLACDLAALLDERDILRGAARDGDVRLRLQALRDRRDGGAVDRGALSRVRQMARDARRRLGVSGDDPAGSDESAGLLLALAYPDRIARRRPGGEPRYGMTNGRGACFTAPEPLAAEDWLALAELDGDRRESRIFLAAPLTLAAIEAQFEDRIVAETLCAWDGREEMVRAVRVRRLDRLVLDERRDPAPDPATLARAMSDGIRAMGPACLPWSAEIDTLRRRVALARSIEPDAGWPDLSDAALLDDLDSWLGPHLAGITRRAHLARLDLAAALGGCLDWEQRRRLESLLPTHVVVPSGSKVAIDYSGEVPVLAVRLQEMFGCADTPTVMGGRVPLLLHLLSPARRPVQVTRDLAGFWSGAYRAVKADLKGQYPRHWWPDDPMQAEPTARAKPRR